MLNNIFKEKKSKNIFIDSWINILLDKYVEKSNDIITIYDDIIKLNVKRLKTLESLIKSNNIFYQKYIIKFFMKLREKDSNFNVYDLTIETLWLINSVIDRLRLVYFIFYTSINFKKTKNECLQEILIFNNMVVSYLND